MGDDEQRITLKEYFNEKLHDFDRLIDQRIEEVRNIIDKSELELKLRTDAVAAQLGRRLDGMNEFRETLKDQAARFITRSDVDAFHRPVLEAIRKLELDQKKMEGRAKTTAMVSAILTSIIVGLVVSIVSHYITK